MATVWGHDYNSHQNCSTFNGLLPLPIKWINSPLMMSRQCTDTLPISCIVGCQHAWKKNLYKVWLEFMIYIFKLPIPSGWSWNSLLTDFVRIALWDIHHCCNFVVSYASCSLGISEPLCTCPNIKGKNNYINWCVPNCLPNGDQQILLGGEKTHLEHYTSLHESNPVESLWFY